MILGDQSLLAGAMEYFLTRAFQYKNSARSSGWWCDGVELSVRPIGSTAFQVVGVAVWAESGKAHSPFYLAPFELEFYYSSPRDLCSSRVIIRFGQVDHRGEIVKTPYNANANRHLGRRPKTDAQWAFAIELS